MNMPGMTEEHVEGVAQSIGQQLVDSLSEPSDERFVRLMRERGLVIVDEAKGPPLTQKPSVPDVGVARMPRAVVGPDPTEREDLTMLLLSMNRRARRAFRAELSRSRDLARSFDAARRAGWSGRAPKLEQLVEKLTAVRRSTRMP